MDTFGRSSAPVLVTISPYSLEAIGARIIAMAGTTLVGNVSAVYPTQNLAIAYPFILAERTLFKQYWWLNGTGVAGNIDVAIYDENFARLYSTGATAQSGVSSIQVVAMAANTYVGPGQFYMAISFSDGTGVATIFRGVLGVAQSLVFLGGYQMAAAHPLPATLVPASLATNFIPLFGITTNTVI